MNIKSIFQLDKKSIITLIFLFAIGIILLGLNSIGGKIDYSRIGLIIIVLLLIYIGAAVILKFVKK